MTKLNPLEGFDPQEVLARLHGFQRDAVEYAFDRLFRSDGSRRFLIADEVGLGKTLIARGVLAKALEFLQERVERIDVVYICSNLGIAQQNIRRLNPLPNISFGKAERVTLLPVHLDQLEEKRLNFVAFTPGTSLDLGGSMGTARERILLCLLLSRHWNLKGTAALNLLQGDVQDPQRFRTEVVRFRETDRISEELASEFFHALDLKPELATRFASLCERFQRPRQIIPDQERRERRELVGELRAVLARTCINRLEPDLVILDEFQRFKDLLNPQTEQGELANLLFRWSKDDEKSHVLLLSATPYKAYTLHHEAQEDDHYADFIRTIAFLEDNPEGTTHFTSLLREYRNEMFRLRDSDGRRMRELKVLIEDHLRRVMSRTERLSAGAAANGMVRLMKPDMRVSARDLRAYGAIRRLSDNLKTGDAIEYWKSAAYPINFIEGYELRRELIEQAERGPNEGLVQALNAARSEGLSFDTIGTYGDLAPIPNARARAILDELVRGGAFGPLWIPPSYPYYRLSGPFAEAVGLTKRLVFSAWNMVPRSLATLFSYESERRAFNSDEQSPNNSAEARRARRGLLRFSQSDNRLTGMPVLTLIYPSRSLAQACDPRAYYRERAVEVPYKEGLCLGHRTTFVPCYQLTWSSRPKVRLPTSDGTGLRRFCWTFTGIVRRENGGAERIWSSVGAPSTPRTKTRKRIADGVYTSTPLAASRCLVSG
jgi:hypothetical protein